MIWYPVQRFEKPWLVELGPDLYRPPAKKRVHDFVATKLESWTELHPLLPPVKIIESVSV